MSASTRSPVMIHGSTTSAIVAFENIEHEARLKIGNAVSIGEPEHASRVCGSPEADDFGAGHIECAQGGIERVDRVSAGGQHEIGPFTLQALDFAGDDFGIPWQVAEPDDRATIPTDLLLDRRLESVPHSPVRTLCANHPTRSGWNGAT